MNKIKELVITEMMPFYIINQAILGPDSQDDSWKENSLFKFVHAGQEFGLTVGSTEGGGFALNGMPISQPVNLDRSTAIKTRIELAQLFKNESYAQIGISPQFLGDVKSDETATGILQGINRSATQIQHLFTDHYNLMKAAKQYMIELAQVKAFKRGGIEELSYVNSDAQNMIFTINAEDLPLTKRIGLFVVDNTRSNEVLEKMKQLAVMDNTMGADAYEKLLIIRANSESSLLDKLFKEKVRREEREDAQLQNQQALNDQSIKAQQEAQLALQTFEAEQNELDRQAQILIAEIRSIGQTKNPDSNANSMFDAAEMLTHSRENQKMVNDLKINSDKISSEKEARYQDLLIKQKEIDQKRDENLNNYRAKLKEIDAKLKDSETKLKIAKENKNKYNKK